MANKRGRPPKVKVEDLIKDADKYIKSADPPIIAEYAHKHGITRQYLYELAKDNPELSDTIKRISEAKEVMLERGALKGWYHPTMAVFSLKQLGWKDKQADTTSDTAIAFMQTMTKALKERALNDTDTITEAE